MSTQARTAIVTGAARGIGAAIAQRLFNDGFNVAVMDLDESTCRAVATQIDGGSGRTLGVGVDVSDEDSTRNAIAKVVQEFGGPTVLVNNAGITRDNLLFKMTTDEWDAVMNVHLRGAFLMSRATQRYMVDASWGRIINVSSTSALGNRGQANYAAAKAGIQGFTKTLAIELGKFGVTVNAIAPGFVETEMTKATAARMGISFEAFKESALRDIAVNRTGHPEDIAAMASFFAREDSSFVSGQIVYVAGGPRA